MPHANFLRAVILCQLEGEHFGKRTLWSATIDDRHLLYCDKCFSSEVKSLLRDCYAHSELKLCGRCCQWDMILPSSANTEVKAPEVSTTERFPTVADPHSPPAPRDREVPSHCLKPVELDFEWLLCKMRYAAHHVLHKHWNKGQARAYCTSASINERATEKMINHCHSVRANVSSPGIGEAINSTDYVPRV